MKIITIMKNIEFFTRISKIIIIIEFHKRIMKITKKLIIPFDNDENYENHKISLENYENHENHIIPV